MKPETKARILAHYVGYLDVNGNKLDYSDIEDICLGYVSGYLPIQLKSIDNITDEDAALLGYHKEYVIIYNKTNTLHFHYDTLRQLGYATPHTVIEDGKVDHYGVEELVEEGLFKII